MSVLHDRGATLRIQLVQYSCQATPLLVVVGEHLKLLGPTFDA